MRNRWLLLLALLLGIAFAASAAESRREQEDRANDEAEPVPDPSVVEVPDGDRPGDEAAERGLSIYIPPSRGEPRARVGGGTRSSGNRPTLVALVPDHVALTVRKAPTLAWYNEVETRAPLVLTVLHDGSPEPLVEQTLAGGAEAGFAQVSLAEFDVELEEDVVYEWFVAWVVDAEHRDRDVVAGGAVRRVAKDARLSAELAAASDPYRVLAAHGLWYDALADLSERIAAGHAGLRAQRAALLEQVGLEAPAAVDRAVQAPRLRDGPGGRD